jgi:hypothetical protein
VSRSSRLTNFLFLLSKRGVRFLFGISTISPCSFGLQGTAIMGGNGLLSVDRSAFRVTQSFQIKMRYKHDWKYRSWTRVKCQSRSLLSYRVSSMIYIYGQPMARMMSVLSSWTLYVKVQIDNQEPERGQHASSGTISTLAILFVSSQSPLLDLTTHPLSKQKNSQLPCVSNPC